jgi:glycosyltransferase involved in cell wall biosynthesis
LGDGRALRAAPPPRVSVVIPAHNRLPLLREAVASVRAQTLESWELVVVDDASEDGTREWLAGLDDPRIRVELLPQPGERCRARNRGTELSRGEFVLYLDQDDRLLPRALARLTGVLTARPDAVAVAGGLVGFDEATQAGIRISTRRVLAGSMYLEALTGTLVFGTGMSLFRTRAVRTAGPWDEAYLGIEDVELSVRVLALGPAVVVPDLVLEKRRYSSLPRPGQEELQRRLGAMQRAGIARLSGARRARAVRVLRANDHAMRSAFAIRAGRYAAGLGEAARAFRGAPGFWLRPAGGRRIRRLAGRSLAGSLLGRRALHLADAIRASLRPFVPADARIRADPEALDRARRRARAIRRGALLDKLRSRGRRGR